MSWLEKCDGPEDPISYLRGLVNRAAATQTWLEKSEQGRLLGETLDLSELFHPDTFLNALRQQTARWTTSLDCLLYDRCVSFVWLNGFVVSALGMWTQGPGFDYRVASLSHWVATVGKLFTHIASAVFQLQETGIQKGSFRRQIGYGD